MPNLLEVEDLNVWFSIHGSREVHAVRGVSFSVDAREKIGLVGESGCGKSTSILAIMGLLPANASVSGRILLNGTDILAGGEKTIKQHRLTDIAMVFQGAMNAFNPVTRVRRQIADAIVARRGAKRRDAHARAGELLEMVGIPSARADGYPHQFSGGMKQRAAIALALSCEPRVLLADEPTTALDVMVQAQVMELLERLCDEQGLALVIVSHDLPLIAQACDRINVMYAGEIVESAGVTQMRSSTAHPYTRLLFAATPDIHDESPLASIPGVPPRLDRPVVGCAFQPRCDRAFEPCTTDPPLLKIVRPGQLAACHLNDVRGQRDRPVALGSPRAVSGRNNGTS
jgi:peptide/nickel transport system ATP-binding protein